MNQFLIFSCQQVLVFGRNGGNGQSVTPPAPVARSSDSATATMLPRLLPAMATPLRRLRARSLLINHLAKTPPVQVNLDPFIGFDDWPSWSFGQNSHLVNMVI